MSKDDGSKSPASRDEDTLHVSKRSAEPIDVDAHFAVAADSRTSIRKAQVAAIKRSKGATMAKAKRPGISKARSAPVGMAEAATPFTIVPPAAHLRPATGPAKAHFKDYSKRLSVALATFDWTPVEQPADDLLDCWKTGRQVFLCGNGGSAGNANHLANDFIYALSKRKGSGLRVHALSANPAILTCLANDEGYDNVFGHQLAVQARQGDVLIAFSGSGNSPNILNALQEARRLGMRSYAVLGFDGGKAKAMSDVPIHFVVDDMQIAEDTQTVIGHMIVQWLYARRDEVPGAE